MKNGNWEKSLGIAQGTHVLSLPGCTCRTITKPHRKAFTAPSPTHHLQPRTSMEATIHYSLVASLSFLERCLRNNHTHEPVGSVYTPAPSRAKCPWQRIKCATMSRQSSRNKNRTRGGVVPASMKLIIMLPFQHFLHEAWMSTRVPTHRAHC